MSISTAWAEPLRGDTNCDGIVSTPDLDIFEEEYYKLTYGDPSTQCQNCEACGMIECGDTCVDNSTDEDNCGSCGNTCESYEICDNGTCDVPSPTCEGTLSPGGRWCDQLDGTVRDMTTELVWLKDASWGGLKPWRNPSTDCSLPNNICYDDAHTRASILKAGTSGAGLSDGSVQGDWRLPTKTEQNHLTHGTEAVLSSSPQLFTSVQLWYHWSSSSLEGYTSDMAWRVHMTSGTMGGSSKFSSYYVWPVRPDN